VRPVELTPYGEHGLLLQLAEDDGGDEFDPAATVSAWAETLRAARLEGVLDIVPAARSVLLHLAESQSAQRIRDTVVRLQPLPPVTDGEPATVEIPVIYDGPDLADVAAATGLDAAGIVAAHTATAWRAAFAGFAPGFAYLIRDDDTRLSVPRRVEPRTRVPAGSVALAAGYSAVYPRASPGGWQLIGRTDRPMWDLLRDPPALLTPGTPVRFVERPG
jgi:KipI family sensor histidine kinase inhibitor